jgi:hypothetical protein
MIRWKTVVANAAGFTRDCYAKALSALTLFVY